MISSSPIFEQVQLKSEGHRLVHFTPVYALLKSGPISALVFINRSVIAYYNTIRAKEMREGKMLSANVD